MGITASCFAQVLSQVDRNDFVRAVRLHDAEKACKGFSCWDQFVSMSFCQLGGANSLREICGGLATALGKLVHLGMDGAPARSTLAYANENRPWQVYQDVFYSVLNRCGSLAATKGRRFRFKNPLRSLDSTVVDLCLKVFDWARFRRTKGAIKLHLQLDHQGCLPCWALVTEGKTHDVKAAQGLSFAPGTIVAMDRGYNDYRLFAAWTAAEVFFVTRAKDNMVYEVVEEHEVPERGNILSDETICLTGVGAEEKCPYHLRRIVVWDEENAREIVLLTNIFHLAASTVAAIYKERWQIELFFKALKQNLKVKTFVGTSENAVKTQIWIALIAILLLKYLQLRSSWGWSLSNLAAMLRFNLLTYRDLWAWLDAPYQVPILESQETQLEFFAP
ncbi:MAG: IS4 family transposase [Planctomycetes bacterium]|nr:IS4 family transposase [Planctomycetota bacterium]